MERVRELVRLAGGATVLRTITEGVWRRSTNTTVYGTEAMATRTYGYQCARAGGLFDLWNELTRLTHEAGLDAVRAAAVEHAEEQLATVRAKTESWARSSAESIEALIAAQEGVRA